MRKNHRRSTESLNRRKMIQKYILMTRILKTTHKYQKHQPLQATEIWQKLSKVKINCKQETNQ